MEARSCDISIGKGALSRHAQQLRRSGDVIGGVAIAGMAEVRRQQRQACLNVSPVPMPGGKPVDGEAMAQIMRPDAIEASKPAGGTEGRGEARRRQPIAAGAEKECGIPWHWEYRIAMSGVVA